LSRSKALTFEGKLLALDLDSSTLDTEYRGIDRRERRSVEGKRNETVDRQSDSVETNGTTKSHSYGRRRNARREERVARRKREPTERG
ncbi:hypothetical protein ALC60_08639, partial [Trachymyrmex zeteki]